MDESEKASSINQFERLIYPIWMGIEQKDHENESKMAYEEVAAVNVLMECTTLHRQDRAIKMSGHRCNRMGGAQEVMQHLRKKADRAGAY